MRASIAHEERYCGYTDDFSLLTWKMKISPKKHKLLIDISEDSDTFCFSVTVSCSTVPVLQGAAVRQGLRAALPHLRDVPGRT